MGERKIDMPDEGWQYRVQEAVCEWCGPLRRTSFYSHPESERLTGMTPAEFTLEIHRNDAHTYRHGVWIKRHGYRWYSQRFPVRQFDWVRRWVVYLARKTAGWAA